MRTQSGLDALPRPTGRRALAVPRPERRPPLHVRSAGCAAALWHSEGAAGPLGRHGGANARVAVVGRPAGPAGTAASGQLHAEWGAGRLTWYVERALACTREPLLQVCCPRRCPARRRVLGARATFIVLSGDWRSQRARIWAATASMFMQLMPRAGPPLVARTDHRGVTRLKWQRGRRAPCAKRLDLPACRQRWRCTGVGQHATKH